MTSQKSGSTGRSSGSELLRCSAMFREADLRRCLAYDSTDGRSCPVIIVKSAFSVRGRHQQAEKPARSRSAPGERNRFRGRGVGRSRSYSRAATMEFFTHHTSSLQSSSGAHSRTGRHDLGARLPATPDTSGQHLQPTRLHTMFLHHSHPLRLLLLILIHGEVVL